MPKEYEDNEGKKAQKDFEEGMKALFQVPKDVVKAKKKPAKNGLRKPANQALPVILAVRLKAPEASSVRVSQEVHGQ